MKTDTIIVVLGKGINPDGSLPEEARHSVAKGAELFKQGKSDGMIVSGGLSFSINYKPPRTEARAMKEYAIELGVPPNAIGMEEKSLDTAGNAYFVKEMIAANPAIRNVILVTVEYHMERAGYLFGKALSDRFGLEFVSSDSGITGKPLEQKIAREKHALELTRKLYDNMEPGHFDETLRRSHPLYTTDPSLIPEAVWEEFRRRGFSKERILSLGYYKANRGT